MADPVSSPRPGVSSMKVMIVDDEPAVLRTYRVLLQRVGHKIVGAASNGAEAVGLYRALLGDQRPDVVLMDHRMPLKDGVSACREILGIDPKACVIIATADASVKDLAIEAGAVRFKVKPFTPAELYENLASLDSRP